jgi:hypothetical protein
MVRVMSRRPIIKKRAIPPERLATFEEVKAVCDRMSDDSWSIGAVVWHAKRSLEREGHAVPEELIDLLTDPEVERQTLASREKSRHY